jgi:hypothetical protein
MMLLDTFNYNIKKEIIKMIQESTYQYLYHDRKYDSDD